MKFAKEREYALWAAGVWAAFTIILEAIFVSPQGLTFFDPIAAGTAAWGLYGVIKNKVSLLNRFSSAVLVAELVKHAVCSATGPGWAALVSIPIAAALAAITFNLLALVKKDARTDDRKKPILDTKKEKYPILLDDKGAFFISTEVQKEHVQVIGGSGSGKTVFMKRAMYQMMDNGAGMFITDPKSDYAKTIAYYAKLTGRVSDFRYFDIADPSRSQTFNPLYGSDPDEVFNKMVLMLFPKRNEENPFYYSQAVDVLSNLTILILKEERTATFSDYRQILSSEMNSFNTLAYLCAKYPDTEQSKYFSENWLTKSPDDRMKNLSGLTSRINRFCGRKWSNLINCRNPQVTISDVVENNRVFVFGTSVLANIEDAKSLNIAALLDHGPAISKRMKNPPERPFCIFLDEFYNAAFPDFIEIINKCRQANMPCFLAHQSLGDLEAISKTFRSQILDNTRTKVVLAVSSVETVDYYAKLFGTVRTDQSVYSYTAQNTVAGRTIKPDEHFRFDPNFLKERGRGHAIVLSRWDDKVLAFEAKIDREVQAPDSFDLGSVAPIRNLDGIQANPIQRKDDGPLTSGVSNTPTYKTSKPTITPKGKYAPKSPLVEKLQKAVMEDVQKKAGKPVKDDKDVV